MQIYLYYRLKSMGEQFEEYYKNYRTIKKTESICYYIKAVSIRSMLDILYKDNYEKIKSWGFFKDNRGNDVFAIDFPYEIGGTFQFHVPEKETELPKYFFDNMEEYKFQFEQITKNKPKYISLRNKNKSSKEKNLATLEKFKENEDREKYYFAIANGMDIFSIFKKENLESNNNSKSKIKTISESELELRQKLIDKLSKDHKIAVQEGTNLDINASIYAIQKFLVDNKIIKDEKDLEVIRVGAGQTKPGIVNLDTGKLRGISSDGLQINADEKMGEKSCCSFLARLGFYVPEQIIKNADKVYGKEIMNPRYGLVLARTLTGKTLFEFAETYRTNGEPLITSNLTDDEIDRFGLREQYDYREKAIRTSEKRVEEHMVELPNKRKAVIVPCFTQYGAYISYAKGANYYISIGDGKDKKGITFAMTANPNTGNGELPKELLSLGYTLREQYSIGPNDGGVFVSQNLDKIIAGGPKNRSFSIYPNEDSEKAKQKFLKTINI